MAEGGKSSFPMRSFCRLAVPVFAALFWTQAMAQQVRSASAALAVTAPPGTIIWVDALRYGAVPTSGKVTITRLSSGLHTLRARLNGKREITQKIVLTANATQTIQPVLTAPADQAELHFQTAEELRAQGKHTEAIPEYRAAIKLRRRGYPAARIGLARSLMTTDEFDEAIAEARRALRENPGLSAEAYTVMANTNRTQGFYEEAVADYRTALKLAGDVSPEAHTGLALAYEDLIHPDDAIKQFRTAIAQANDTEPVIYFLLGNLLERERRNKEALEVYEKYLQLEPNGRQSSAVRSILTRLRRETR